MIRKAFTMPVDPAHHEEYERRHNPIWPELQQAIKEHGVRNYSIFLDKETSTLFGYMEVENEAVWRNLRNKPVMEKWWAYMKEIMPVNPDNSPQSKPLQCVFHLD